MKPPKNSICVLLISALAVYSCQKAPIPFTDSEIEGIKKEVREVFDNQARAASDHNAEVMFTYTWNSPDLLYVGNGRITKGYDANLKMATSIHSNPRYQSFTVDYDEVMIRVISRDAVMITGSGHFNNFPVKEGPRSIEFAVTYLYEKIEGKWLMTVGHESAAEELL